MNFNNKFLWLLLPVFILSACNLQLMDSANSDTHMEALALTITANAQLLESAGQALATEPPAQEQAVVVVTATPEAGAGAPPPTEQVNPAQGVPPATGDVTVTVSTATNCRSGPGQGYPSIYGLPIGVTGKVVGKNPSVSNYWVIEIPNSGGGTCWLWGQYATVTGDTSGLKVFAVPATPTPTASPTPTSTPTLVAQAPADPSNASAVLLTCVTNNFTQSFTATFTWADNSNNENGFNVYVNANFADGSSKDQLAGSVGPNTTSYTVSAISVSKSPPIIKVEAFNNVGSSTRVSAPALSLATCP